MRLVLVCLLLAGATLAAQASPADVDDEFGDEVDEVEVASPAASGARTGSMDRDITGDLDEFEDEEDEEDEEFRGETPEAEDAAKAPEAPAAAPRQPEVPRKGNSLPETWELEIVALAGVVLYIAAYFVGSTTNHGLATAWYEAFGSTGKIIPSSFAKTMLCADDGSPFSKDTANQYRFYASGRRGTLGLIVNLSMLPRQDLLSWVLAMLSGDEDTVTMEIFVEPRSMDPFVLAAVPRRIRRRVQKESGDLAAFASIVEPRRLPAGFGGLSVLTDATEACSGLLKGPTARLIASHAPPMAQNRFQGDSTPGLEPDAALASVPPAAEAPEDAAAGADRAADPLFRMLHVTDHVPYYDRGVTPLSSHAVRFQFKLPPASRMGELQSLTKLAVDFADRVAAFKLTREAVKRNELARKQVQDARRKEQELSSEGSAVNKQREAMAAKDAELKRLQRTDPKEFKKQMKKLETKMMRKKTKMVTK